MKKAASLVFALGAAVALACTPSSWSVADLIYNLQQIDQEAQGATVLRLYSTRDGHTGYGQYVTGLRLVCYRAVIATPAGCDPSFASQRQAAASIRRTPRTPGPGPGPCYVVVVDWGQEPLGADLTAAACEAQTAVLGAVIE